MSEATIVPAAAGGETPQGQTPATTDPQQTATQSQPATSGAQKPVVDEARIAGLLGDLTKERKSRQELEKQFKELRDQHAQREQHLAQVFGGQKSPQEQEAEAVRAAMTQLFPALGKLTPEMLDQLARIANNSNSLESSANAVWDMRASNARDFVFTKVAEAIGADKLSERQQDRLIDGLVHYLDSDEKARKQYEAGSNAPIEAYIKEFLEDWFEPARRRGLQTEVDRQRRVPSGRDRSIPGKDKKPIDFKDNKAVEDAMVEAFKSQGGKFGR
jgi:hypothetical protein